MNTDTYKTLATPSKGILFKDKKSKFYGYAFPLTMVTDVKPLVATLKKEHHTANHVCYAWRMGVAPYTYRTNDDGEPNNSAGMPIYGQIQAFDLTNILVAVVRIFGGTKLGIGGLINAYRTAAYMTLDEAEVIERVMTRHFDITFNYPQMDVVMRLVKQHQLEVVSQELHLKCRLTVSVRQNMAASMLEKFHAIFGVQVQEVGTT